MKGTDRHAYRTCGVTDVLAGMYARSLYSGTGFRFKRLRGARIIEFISLAAAKGACFSEYFLAGQFLQGEHQFLMLERAKEGHIVFMVEKDNRFGRSEKLQSAAPCLGVEFFPTEPQQVPLKQTVSEQYEDHLIDNKIEAA